MRGGDNQPHAPVQLSTSFFSSKEQRKDEGTLRTEPWTTCYLDFYYYCCKSNSATTVSPVAVQLCCGVPNIFSEARERERGYKKATKPWLSSVQLPIYTVFMRIAHRLGLASSSTITYSCIYGVLRFASARPPTSRPASFSCKY